MGMLVIPLVLSVLLAWLTYGLAQRKARSPWLWTMATLFLIFPILILVVLPSVSANGGSDTSIA